jgi:hypothetical protein
MFIRFWDTLGRRRETPAAGFGVIYFAWKNFAYYSLSHGEPLGCLPCHMYYVDAALRILKIWSRSQLCVRLAISMAR